MFLLSQGQSQMTGQTALNLGPKSGVLKKRTLSSCSAAAAAQQLFTILSHGGGQHGWGQRAPSRGSSQRLSETSSKTCIHVSQSSLCVLVDIVDHTGSFVPRVPE